MTARRAIPPRFLIFGGACAAWLAAIVSDVVPAAVAEAGRAWFVVWSVQIAVSLAAWVRPFSFPEPYYDTRLVCPASLRRRRPCRETRLPGLRAFRRAAHAIHPFAVDRRTLGTLVATTRGAETTHAVSFVCVGIAAAIVGSSGRWRFATLLMVWNVLFNLYPAVLQRETRARLAGSRREPAIQAATHAAAAAFPSGSVRLRAPRHTA